MTRIKAAITAGVRPMSILFYEQPSDPWEEFDFRLLEAYQILQDETCPQCGNPIWLCRSESSRIRFKMSSAVCFAEREEKTWRNQKDRNASRGKNGGSWEPRPGETWFPVAVTVDDGPLPTRNDYFKELEAKYVKS